MARGRQAISEIEAFACSLSFEELVEEAELALDRGDVDTALALSEAAERREADDFQSETSGGL